MLFTATIRVMIMMNSAALPGSIPKRSIKLFLPICPTSA